MSQTGVLLLGFGGPETIEAVRPFMCNLMGRTPSDELVDVVCRRYEAIGGGSPLPRIAASMAQGLQERLSAGGNVPVRVGMRYSPPFIADAVADLMDLGCERIVTYSLSPFESKAASGAYREAIAEVADAHGHLEIVEAPLLSQEPEFTDFYATSTQDALDAVGRSKSPVLAFSAHSLPIADLVDDDPYVAGLESVAQSIAERLGLPAGSPAPGGFGMGDLSAFGTNEGPVPWCLVFQSKGARPGAWLGPQLQDVIEVAADSDASAIVVAPVGFATDHMETLYDIDIVAAGEAQDAGLSFSRAKVPNGDPRILDAIARVVETLI